MRRLLFFISTIALALPSVAFAANLSVFPASVALHRGDSVTFYVRVDSTNSINTIGAAVILPPNMTFLSANDGAILTQWIEHPTYHAADKTVSFSGIVQGGWTGSDTLASVKIAVLKDGTYSLAFDPAQTELYKNDGKATPEPVVFGTVSRIPPLTPPFVFGAVLLIIAAWFLFRIIRKKVNIRLV